jgi:hypothetical protein
LAVHLSFEKVRAMVAYLRSIDNRIKSDGTETSTTYQLQQWRNVDLTSGSVPLNYDQKWKLIPRTVQEMDAITQHLRAPRPLGPPNETFTFKIDPAKFAGALETPPTTYRYKVISFEKLETKLHLMGKYPDGAALYTHIEDEILEQDIFNNITLHGGYNNSPIVAEGSFTAGSSEVTINISPLCYTDPDPEDPLHPETFTMSDFIICIKADSEW